MISREEWRALCEGVLGKSYIWRTSGPEAYDFSGFVQWALHLLNLDPTRDQTADGLYASTNKLQHPGVSGSIH